MISTKQPSFIFCTIYIYTGKTLEILTQSHGKKDGLHKFYKLPSVHAFGNSNPSVLMYSRNDTNQTSVVMVYVFAIIDILNKA